MGDASSANGEAPNPDINESESASKPQLTSEFEECIVNPGVNNVTVVSGGDHTTGTSATTSTCPSGSSTSSFSNSTADAKGNPSTSTTSSPGSPIEKSEENTTEDTSGQQKESFDSFYKEVGFIIQSQEKKQELNEIAGVIG